MKLFLMTLGCDKNRVDAEEMLTDLARNNFDFTDDETEAEAIIVNTCCFIDSAKEESIEAILTMAEQKKEGSCKYLMVTGCMAQRYKEEILNEISEVDAVVGTTSFDGISNIIKNLADTKEKTCVIKPNAREFQRPVDRILTTPVHYAYLKIAEGCSKGCSYCVIPSIRGTYRSFEMNELLAQASAMADKGVKELILIAQETTMYGLDLYKKKSLHILLEELCKIEGIHRIRVLYCYPEEIYDELIETMKREEKICNYIDMPIQHCNDDILKKMGRRIDKAGIIRVIGKLRVAIPDIVIRTALITGFPTETKEQHRELVEFLKEMKLDHVGVFSYSREEGTLAGRMEGQISEEMKQERLEELMLTQHEVVNEINQKWIGRELICFIDGYLPDEDVYVARSYADTPDVDSLIFLHARSELESGSRVKVRIESFSDYDFEAVEVEESELA